MNKKSFADELSRRTGMEVVKINNLFEISSNIVAEKTGMGENVELPKLGTFEVSHRKAAIYKNLFGDKEEKKSGLIHYPIFKINPALKRRVKEILRVL